MISGRLGPTVGDTRVGVVEGRAQQRVLESGQIERPFTDRVGGIAARYSGRVSMSHSEGLMGAGERVPEGVTIGTRRLGIGDVVAAEFPQSDMSCDSTADCATWPAARWPVRSAGLQRVP